MMQLTQLPVDVLRMIIIMMVTSPDGAGHLARFAAVCKQFRQLVNHDSVLSVVGFAHLTATDVFVEYDYGRHHHPRDLIWVCAHNGNPAAKIMLAKALLCQDAFFWDMILGRDERVIFGDPSGIGILCHYELVRNFIRRGSDLDISRSRWCLVWYGYEYLGYNVSRESGYVLALHRMCNFYLTKREILSTNVQEDLEGDDARINEIVSHKERISPPTSGEALREEVLQIYNQVVSLIRRE